MFNISRTEESQATSWYYETDRRLLWCLLALIFLGILCVISAGSVQSMRKGWEWYRLLVSMLPFYIAGIIALFATSMFSKKLVIGLSALNLAVCYPLVLATMVFAQRHHGSMRWIRIMGIQLMPSDLMKPGFIIMTAWFLTKMREKYGDNIFTNRRAWEPHLISWWTYIGLFLVVLGVLFRQPDIGTTILYCATLGMMMFVAGLPKIICWAFGGLMGLGGILAFIVHPHVHRRVMEFLFAPLDPRSQVGYAVNTIRQGGLLGMGDKAFAKTNLPDAHTDFIFASIVEDVGALPATCLLGLMLYVLYRLTRDAMDARSSFVFYATVGTAALFGTQVCINLATTLHLMPPKGMTLPFVSFGGSSFLGYCVLFGLTLALIRQDKWK